MNVAKKLIKNFIGLNMIPKLLKEENCTIVIQVDGKKRGIIKMPMDSRRN